MSKETSSFDRAIWRINGILILGVFIALAVITLFTDYNYTFQKDSYSRPVRSVVTVSEEGAKSVVEHLYLGQFREISSDGNASAPLYSDTEKQKVRYPRASSSIRNYYYYNTKTAEGNWLFDNNNFLITDRQTLREGIYRHSEGGKVHAYIYTVVDKDTNNDGRLSDLDKRTLYVSDPAGKNVQKVVEGIETILGSEIVISEGKLFLFAQESDGEFAYDISLDGYTVNSKLKIEIPK